MYLVLDLADKYPCDSLAAHILHVVPYPQFLPVFFSIFSFFREKKMREDGERGEREGEDTQALSLSSGTHRIHNSLVDHAGRFLVVELREPRFCLFY